MPPTISDEQLVTQYLEGVYLEEDLPSDYDSDNGYSSTTRPEINGKVKMVTTKDEVGYLLESASKWVAGKLGFMDYDSINPTGKVVDEARILYAAARLKCKKMKDSDEKKEVNYSTTCLKENELYQSALEILEDLKEDSEEKEYINENLTGWI